MKTILILCFSITASLAQTSIQGYSYKAEDSLMVKNIFSEVLADFTSYNNLEYLCKNMKGRICGSPQAADAVEYTFSDYAKHG
jgi:hypothetical protein